MPAAVTEPVEMRLVSTYACHDMVKVLPQRISAGEGRAAVPLGERPNPEPNNPNPRRRRGILGEGGARTEKSGGCVNTCKAALAAQEAFRGRAANVTIPSAPRLQ